MNSQIFPSSFLILIYCSASFINCANVIYPPNDFFPVNDVTGVTWAHAVNSQEELASTLANPTIRMIEADLSRGWLNTSGNISPWEHVIMAHPPNIFSDLSFVSFIDQIIEYNKDKPLEEMKGVKLDCKDYFSAVFSTLILRGRNESSNGTALQFPVWLNADIVPGPVNSTSVPKVDGVDLLKLHNVNLPDVVLSLGWTTRFGQQSDGEVINEGSYTRENMDDMIKVFRDFSANPIRTQNIPVTFAVRAILAQNSLGNLLYLLNATSYRSSITLWAGADDPKINTTRLGDMIKLVGKNRVFIDLPYDDWQESGGNKNIENNLVMIFIAISCLVRIF